MLRVTMLQTPRVELDGREIVFPFRRADALFYYMLVRRSATRQELIALLWESCDDTTGLKNLRNTVYTLKKALGGEFLLAPNKTTLQVNPAWELECDYDRFMREEDFTLYRGEFLQGFAVKQTFSFDIWMERTRETLRERYLMLLFRSAQMAAERGDEARAQLLASDYLREENCDEGVAAFLMESHLRMRSYAKAAEVYQRLRERLTEELGTEPQRRTTELYLRIMDEWNRDALRAEESRELLSDALTAARMLSIFQGEADFSLLVALCGEEETLSRGLRRLEKQGLAHCRTEEGRELWYFTDSERLEELRCAIPYTERQQLHRRAAELLLHSRSEPTGELCRAAAKQYAFARDNWNAILWGIRGLDLSSDRSCTPFPVEGATSMLQPDFLWEEELHRCRDALTGQQNSVDEAEFARLERLLTLCRGRIAIFRGDREAGNALIGSLTGHSAGRDTGLLMRSCALLAGECICRQDAAVGERYVFAGEQLAGHADDTLWSAVFLRMRGHCFYLRGESDKALYYLSEARDMLERLPDRPAVRLQTAAVNEVHGCIMSDRGDYAQASHSFRLALEAMEGEHRVEESWICAHYGRTAFRLEDHTRARMLFTRAREASMATGALWGRGTAEAYLAWYGAQDERFEAAVQHLSAAQKAAEQIGSPLEKGIVCYISMLLRARLDAEQRPPNRLSELLKLPAEEYARLGLRHLSNLPETFERGELSRGLRDGILKSRGFRARELYSRERHFMTE